MRSSRLPALAITLLLAACGPSLTEDRYERIETGMTLDEVRDVLGGQGEQESGGGVTVGGLDLSGAVYRWESGERVVTVTFANGKVVLKSRAGF